MLISPDFAKFLSLLPIAGFFFATIVNFIRKGDEKASLLITSTILFVSYSIGVFSYYFYQDFLHADVTFIAENVYSLWFRYSAFMIITIFLAHVTLRVKHSDVTSLNYYFLALNAVLHLIMEIKINVLKTSGYSFFDLIYSISINVIDILMVITLVFNLEVIKIIRVKLWKYSSTYNS